MVSEKHKERMFEIAHLIKFWSPCTLGRQHGCVLAMDGKYIVSTGFNDVCKGKRCEDYLKCLNRKPLPASCKAIHAEENAILNLLKIGFTDVSRLVAFVTKEPCWHCKAILKNIGIKKVYWLERKY